MRASHVIAVSAAVILSTAMGAARAAGDYGPLQVVDSSAGKVLADEKGMTLYTYDKDTKGKSNCSGECAEYWPPAKASADAKPAGDLTLIKRDDGTMQWADGGKPLYTFAKDKKPGDVTGDGKNGVWHVVKE
jgi:predicted lipoprotein with Yx(FWY)xxD motif